MKLSSLAVLLFASSTDGLLRSGNEEDRILAEQGPCADSGASCRDDKLVPIACCENDDLCNPYDWTCAHKHEVEDLKHDREMDFKNKKKSCETLEKSMIDYYSIIGEIIDEELDDSTEAGKATTLDFLCRTDKRDPGCRSQASYARWDFITKCQLADVAECKKNFFDAAKNQEILFRKVTGPDDKTWGTIEYAREPKAFVKEMKDEGYEVLEDCEFGYWDEKAPDSPFWDQPVPYKTEDLATACGDAGYGYTFE